MRISVKLDKFDCLVEKYLDGFMRGSTMVDIFVNPSKKEQKDAQTASGSYSKNLRFIADGNKKNIYVWNAALCLHSDMLIRLQQMGHVSKSVKLYQDPDVASGELTPEGKVELYYNANWGPAEMASSLLDNDWSWVDKKVKNFTQELIKAIVKDVDKKRIDPKVAKALGLEL